MQTVCCKNWNFFLSGFLGVLIHFNFHDFYECFPCDIIILIHKRCYGYLPRIISTNQLFSWYSWNDIAYACKMLTPLVVNLMNWNFLTWVIVSVLKKSKIMNAHEIYESLWNWLMNINIFMKDNCDKYWKLEIPNYSRKIKIMNSCKTLIQFIRNSIIW